MKYITGIYALNLPCSLETCGDWHTSALDWQKLNSKLRESDNSLFGDYGLEVCDTVPENTGSYYIANTLRALLDLLIDDNIGEAQGIKDDFICNDRYTIEFFEKVIELRNLPNWERINDLMSKEYLFEWDKFKEDRHIQ